jgi:hypothetical protein
MIKKVAGYLLMAIGSVAFIYFWEYKGSLIPLPFLWAVVSLLVVALGGYLVYKYRLWQQKAQDRYEKKRLKEFKRNSEMILLTTENCEVRGNSYHEEIISDKIPTRSEMNDALYDPNRNYKQKFVELSVLIHYYNDDKSKRMVSQNFEFSKELLKKNLEEGFFVLYVNRFNWNDYVFAWKHE